MARVNLEEEFYAGGSLRKAGKELGSEKLAIGYLAFLWHDSQAELRATGTWGEIADWLRTDTEVEAETVIAALLKSGFLKQLDHEHYEIAGNEEQIEARVKKLKASQKGAEATQKKWAELKGKQKEGHKQAISPRKRRLKPSDDEAITTLNSIQFNSTQFNSIQDNSIQCNSDLNLASSVEPAEIKISEPEQIKPTTLVWESYAEAYKRRYGTAPVRNAKTNSQITQLVKRLSESEAPDVAAFYVTHNAWKYTNAGHAIGMLLLDAEKLRTEWATNRQITSSEGKALDSRQTNLNAFAAVAQKRGLS
jgi:hypothetical protein